MTDRYKAYHITKKDNPFNAFIIQTVDEKQAEHDSGGDPRSPYRISVGQESTNLQDLGKPLEANTILQEPDETTGLYGLKFREGTFLELVDTENQDAGEIEMHPYIVYRIGRQNGNNFDSESLIGIYPERGNQEPDFPASLTPSSTNLI